MIAHEVMREELSQPHRTVSAEELAEWNKNGGRNYEIELHNPEAGIKVILIGEGHDWVLFSEQQWNLVERIRPAVILHEGLNGMVYTPGPWEGAPGFAPPPTGKLEEQPGRKISEFDRQIMKDMFSDPRYGDDRKVLLSMADQMGCQVVGCDLTYAEMHAIKPISSPEELAQNNPKKTPEGKKLRKEFMIKMILEHVQKSSGPVIVILGSFHSDKIHQEKALQDKGFGYAVVTQYRPG